MRGPGQLLLLGLVGVLGLLACGCQQRPSGEAPNATPSPSSSHRAAMPAPVSMLAPSPAVAANAGDLLARKKEASARLPAAEFAALDQAALSFFGARESSEVDRSGPLGAGRSIEERARLDEAFVAALRRVLDPLFPEDAGDSRATEAEHDSVYLRLVTCQKLAAAEPEVPGALTRNGIRDAERLFISYRDAWIALGTRARPSTSPDLWRSWITRERTAMLRLLTTGC